MRRSRYRLDSRGMLRRRVYFSAPQPLLDRVFTIRSVEAAESADWELMQSRIGGKKLTNSWLADLKSLFHKVRNSSPNRHLGCTTRCQLIVKSGASSPHTTSELLYRFLDNTSMKAGVNSDDVEQTLCSTILGFAIKKKTALACRR